MHHLAFTPHDFPIGCRGRVWLRGVTTPFRFSARRGYIVLDDFIYSPIEVLTEIVVDIERDN